MNFCKFTNETRNGIEDSSRHSGFKFLAALNGTCAGGGYELALACDEIVMVDDRSSTVSLPEVPLLGVLPGTGGLTRLTDKRKVRRDLADVFCTTAEGVRADRAKDWKLVDAHRQAAAVRPDARRAREAIALRRAHVRRLTMRRRAASRSTPLEADDRRAGYHYPNRRRRARSRRAHRDDHRQRAAATSDSRLDRSDRPRGADWWPLALARELDDAILMLRTNELDIGTWVMQTARRSAAMSGRSMRRCRNIRRPLVRARDDRPAAPHACRGSTCRRARCSR